MNTGLLKTLSILFLTLPIISSASETIHDYACDRARDFQDIYRARVALPEKSSSFAFKARATSLFQVGAVRFKGRMHGVDQRDCGPWDQTRKEVGASLLYFTSVQSQPACELCPTGEHGYNSDFLHYNGWDAERKTPFSLGLMVQPFFIPGVDLGLYPGEVVDFALGVFNIDMFKDDKPKEPARTVRPLLAGEPNFNHAHDFRFDSSVEKELEPFVYPEDK